MFAGVEASTVIAVADECRMQLLHWNQQDVNKRQAVGPITTTEGHVIQVPVAALTTNGKVLTTHGERVIKQVRAAFLQHKGKNLEVMIATHPHLTSIEQYDWSVAREQPFWLHNSLKSRWESRMAAKYTAAAALPPPPPSPPNNLAAPPPPSASNASAVAAGAATPIGQEQTGWLLSVLINELIRRCVLWGLSVVLLDGL
jgi:hypothetical protein